MQKLPFIGICVLLVAIMCAVEVPVSRLLVCSQNEEVCIIFMKETLKLDVM
jgi:hypothetical protein